jgi:hypothetical protein
MRRSRTSLHLSYHCLLRVFRERAERGAFSDNTRAREALADEIARTETPPAAIFVDALEFPLRYYMRLHLLLPKFLSKPAFRHGWHWHYLQSIAAMLSSW